MRDLTELDGYRVPVPKDIISSGNYVNLRRNGAFIIDYDPHTRLRVIASAGGGWDHVSVSLEDRIPTWYEMEYIKRLFFKPDEVAMQLHVPAKDHINTHPFVLHLWRPHKSKIPLPPKEYV